MNDVLCSEVSIETLAPMRVACYRAASLSPEEDGAKFMLDWWGKQTCGGTQVRHFGFDVDVTPEEQKDGLRGYEIRQEEWSARACIKPGARTAATQGWGRN
jgi:hypothetical protein